MGLFDKILEKLGLKKAKTAPQVPPAPQAGPAAPPAPTSIPVVDVVAKLEKLAASNPQKLNWKVSIADLLKLLGLESSFAARKELAVELGCPSEKMGDSAQMNMWLRKTVLQKLADNGGNIPKELHDKRTLSSHVLHRPSPQPGRLRRRGRPLLWVTCL